MDNKQNTRDIDLEMSLMPKRPPKGDATHRSEIDWHDPRVGDMEQRSESPTQEVIKVDEATGEVVEAITEPNPQRSEQELTAKLVKNDPFTGYRVAIGNDIISTNLFRADAEVLISGINAALAAEHQAGWHEGRQYEAKFGVKPPQHSEQWTPERLMRYLDTKAKDGSFKQRMAIMADDINAALAAAREEVRVMTNQCVQLRQELAAERQRADNSERYERNANAISAELEKRLLSALAAIEQHNDQCDTCPYHGYKITVDLSLLHHHDTEVRKPLVDALVALRDGPQRLTKWAQRVIADALAKVKEQN